MAYIMVIDDDEDFAQVVAKVLKSSGHEAEILLDTKSAAQRMVEKTPDAVILDVMFPEDSNAGFDFARWIKSQRDKFEGVPVLMLTAINEKSPIRFSTRDIDPTWLPVTDFLEKPVDLDVLKHRVTALLAKAKSSART